MTVALKPASDKNWLARLQLHFAGRADKTVLAHRAHVGPLVVQKPFYPEGGVCHIYLLHPPGGVAGGDELHLQAQLSANAQTLITTPAASKFYRSDGRVAQLQQILKIAAGCALEWLPQETILFAGCNAHMTTRVELAGDARFIGWEMLCLGRPASGEIFNTGFARQRFEIWRDGAPLVIDRASLAGGSELLNAQFGMQGYTTSASLMATPVTQDMLDAVRETLAQQQTEGLFSATLIDDVLIVRALARQAEHARNVFINVWHRLRPMLLQREACAPRIWAT
jgi:urease accessory protein